MNLDMETKTTMETKRLTLRPWEESDAPECFRYASNPKVGYVAGWPAHADVEDSLRIIQDVFSYPETYAIVLKATGLPIGCIALMLGERSKLVTGTNECELGYWLGEPYWGQGIMTEAAEALLHRAFGDLHMQKVWCAHYDGNHRSMRVMEKCGFRFVETRESVDVPLLHETRTAHIRDLTREEWMHDTDSPAP